MLNDTQIPASRVPITEGEGLPSRSWFRFFSSLYNFIGLGSGAVPTTSGGTGLTSYNAGDLLYAPTANTLANLHAPGAGNICYLGTDGTNMPQWIQVAYAEFSDSTTQTTTANTPKAITLNTTLYHNHVDLGTPTSRVVLQNTGLHNVQFSIQLANPSTTAEDDVAVWIKINGSNLSNSASWITIQKQHAGINGTAILALNLFYEFTANDYFELYWLSKTGTTQLQTIASSTSPSYPASPSIILTVNQII